MPFWAIIFNEKMRDMLYQCYGLRINKLDYTKIFHDNLDNIQKKVEQIIEI